MRAEIKQLRKKLPVRGYTSKILRKANNEVTINQIRNFFAGRAVDADDTKKIVKAAALAIKEMEKNQKKLKRLMKAA